MVWKLELTCDTLHVTPDTGHVTGVMWQTQGSENVVKIAANKLFRFLESIV